MSRSYLFPLPVLRERVRVRVLTFTLGIIAILASASLATAQDAVKGPADKEAAELKALLDESSRPDPNRPMSVKDSIRRGVEYLVKKQNEDGSWGVATETRGFEVFSMVPGTHDGMRVATTALCVMALREASEAGYDVPDWREAHRRGVEHLIEKGEARRDMGMLLYNVWAHKYGLQALSIEMQRTTDPQLKARLRKAAEYQLDRLVRYEVYLGGWNYYDFNAQTQRPSMEATSFGTAAGLVALWEAKRAGINVPEPMYQRALRRLEEQRMPTGAYLYSGDMRYYPMHRANRVRGSVGRTQACNFALWLCGSKKVGEKEIGEGLDMFFKEHAFIDMGRRRQFPHEAWYATAPYYYYFGHYYTGLILQKLGEEGRKEYGPRLASKIVPHQESDGSWWDYAMWGYHKPYGTAFAVMTLVRCGDEMGPLQEAKEVERQDAKPRR